ncbi:SRPBCC family protein [Kitasatospora sp. NPDC006697]|uniref:SRPBCC family protein n=1 Tax=Kitasatospora sp. NPDC006697 TaxID=3364020 RepID=UPI0036C71FAC
MHHRVEVEIAAAPAAVWAVLADIEHWHYWTPSVRLIVRQDPQWPFGTGTRAWISQPRLRRALWEVTACEPERSFRWHTAAPGLRTEAGHLLRAVPGGTLVTLDLRLTGPLAPLGALLYGPLARRYLALEAGGLKTHCESPAPAR